MEPRPYITKINKMHNSESHKRFLACPRGAVLIDIGACIAGIEAIYMDLCHIGGSGDSGLGISGKVEMINTPTE